MMKFPTDRRIALLLCLLFALLALSGCSNTPPTPPPASLQVALADGSAHLTWDAVTEAERYRVYRRISGKDDFKFVSDTQELSYTDVPAQTEYLYDYQVTALGEGGESVGAVWCTLPPSEAVPLTAPVITSVTRLDTGTNVVFFSDSNQDCTYEILRMAENGSWMSLGTTADSIYYDMTAGESDNCIYQVRAVRADDETADSESVAENTNPKEIFGVPVLMYHEFVTQEDLDSGIAFDEYAIYYHEFEHDLQWLQKNGYTTITCRELVEYLSGQGELPEKPVILTIDDGKLGVYKNAYPLLQQYNMKAVLAVIGAEIHAASQNPELRATNPAPYSTWEEVAEMSASGHIEIASHSYGCHIYHHDGRIGANFGGDDDSLADFKMATYRDFRELQDCLKSSGIPTAVTFAYPYSSRSITADEVWFQNGYRILLGGNMESVRTSKINYFIREAGLNDHSALLRRIARMYGTPIEDYIG